MSIHKEMADAVVSGDERQCVELAKKVLAQGIDPLEAIQEGFAAGMEIVGKNFEHGTFYLPNMMMAAEAMKAGVAILEPALASGEDTSASGRNGKVVLATIQGDMHDLGKNIVKLLVSTAGFDVIDLGKDVKVATIIKRAKEENADIIGASALMTTTMAYMRELVEELSELGHRDDFKVMVGGAPVTEDWAKEIGTDGYAKDAFGAVRLAKELVGRA